MTVQVGLLTSGSMPFSAFPGPKSSVAPWKRAIRLQLRAQLRIRPWHSRKASPHSLAADLSIGAPERCHDGCHAQDVNAAGSLADL